MKIEYQTPFGTFGNWIEAAARVEKVDMDPILAIKIIRSE